MTAYLPPIRKQMHYMVYIVYNVSVPTIFFFFSSSSILIDDFLLGIKYKLKQLIQWHGSENTVMTTTASKNGASLQHQHCWWRWFRKIYPFRIEALNYRSAETSIPLPNKTHSKTILYGCFKNIYALDRVYWFRCALNAASADEINELVSDK